jgi:hypothetical protein
MVSAGLFRRKAFVEYFVEELRDPRVVGHGLLILSRLHPTLFGRLQIA